MSLLNAYRKRRNMEEAFKWYEDTLYNVSRYSDRRLLTMTATQSIMQLMVSVIPDFNFKMLSERKGSIKWNDKTQVYDRVTK